MKQYLLNWIRKFAYGFGLIWLCCFFISETCSSNKPSIEPYFIFDENRDPWEVSDMNYETGEVKYYEYGTPPEIKLKNTDDSSDILMDYSLDVADIIDYAY